LSQNSVLPASFLQGIKAVRHIHNAILFALSISVLATGLRADEPKPARPLLALSHEVTALQTLYLLDPAPAQLRALRTMAQETAGKAQLSSIPELNADIRVALADLKKALLDGESPERINKLGLRLQELRNAPGADVDDDIELTDEAIDRAGEAVRLLTPRQTAAYLGAIADDMPDPIAKLSEAIHQVRSLPADKVADYRADVSQEIGEALCGFDSERAANTTNQVTQLLIVVASYKKDEFKMHRADIDARAQKILGSFTPADILKNVMDHVAAELLSNPELPSAIDEMLRARKDAAH
jgi:hypothetical protein